jgi:hypothetical protein
VKNIGGTNNLTGPYCLNRSMNSYKLHRFQLGTPHPRGDPVMVPKALASLIEHALYQI